jgi:hypothetical protein
MILRNALTFILLFVLGYYPIDTSKSKDYNKKGNPDELINKIKSVNNQIIFKRVKNINNKSNFLANHEGKLSVDIIGDNLNLNKVVCSIVEDDHGHSYVPVVNEIIDYCSGKSASVWVKSQLATVKNSKKSFTKVNSNKSNRILFMYSLPNKNITVVIDSFN